MSHDDGRRRGTGALPRTVFRSPPPHGTGGGGGVIRDAESGNPARISGHLRRITLGPQAQPIGVDRVAWAFLLASNGGGSTIWGFSTTPADRKQEKKHRDGALLHAGRVFFRRLGNEHDDGSADQLSWAGKPSSVGGTGGVPVRTVCEVTGNN